MNQKEFLRQIFERPTEVQAWSSEAPTGLSQAEAEYVRSLLDWRGKLVLDVGSGAGRMSLLLATAGARVCALDIAANMVHAASARAASAGVSVSALQGDGENLPFVADTFDVVLCLEALWLFPRPKAAIAEMRRVVKPGGRIILGSNNRFPITYLTTIPYSLYCKMRNRPNYYKAYTIGQLKRWLGRVGLRLTKVHGLGLLPPGINVVLGPGYSGPPYPPVLGYSVLHWEKRYRLGDKWPSRFMKELLIIARREG